MVSWFEALKDLLFPPRCSGCGQWLASSRPPLFCPLCRDQLRYLQSPRCTCCGAPFPTGADHLCGDCLAGRFAFDLARSLLLYRPPASPILRALKYNGRMTGIDSLGALTVASGIAAQFYPPDLVLPVPLSPQRLRERGFNQALLIARVCLPQWQERIDPDLLQRLRHTPPQTRLRGRERRVNLKQAFHLAAPDRVVGRDILLVDDVFTSGSTVHECSLVLRAAGAKRIEVFTLARSPMG